MTDDMHAEPYGGYGITYLREAGGEETLRFDAIITHHGRKVAYVYNAGEGGSHRYQPVTVDAGAAFTEALAAFEQFAAEWNAGSEFAGYEDHDQFVNRLIDVHALNRRRGVLFLLDDESFWETGVARQFRAGVAQEQAVERLSGPEYVHRNPRVWDRTVGEFVPVVSHTVEGQ